jgi:signal peptidase I
MAEEKQEPKQKSAVREWIDSITFAVVAATLIRFFLFEAYTIPTGSMEGSLMTGDFLFVSKLHYGVRTPITPLQVPLTHQKIWGTEIPSYLTWLQLPSYRLPGFSTVKTGDPVVFNVPNYNADGEGIPTDLRTFYIKRCIGTPGDVVEVREGQVFLNNKRMQNPPKLRIEYRVVTNQPIYDIESETGLSNDLNENSTETSLMPEDTIGLGKGNYTVWNVNTDSTTIEEIKKQPFVKKAYKSLMKKGEFSELRTFGMHPEELPMASALYRWNMDNYGAMQVPKTGLTVKLDSANIDKYKHVIKYYENNKNVVIENYKVTIDGKVVSSYTFKNDYYFMMGDNRHGSDDSRFWGFVPAENVVGKAVFVWLSLNPNKGLFSGKIRWNRLFRTIDDF